MTKSEARLIAAALCWWRAHRPLEWTVEQHLENPEINAGYRAGAIVLARAAARVAKERKNCA